MNEIIAAGLLGVFLLILLFFAIRSGWEQQEKDSTANNERFTAARRIAEQEAQQKAQLAENALKRRRDEADRLLAKHRDLLDKFLEITQRKISALDEYGDENWEALPEQIDKCLTKIAKREQAIGRYKWTRQDFPGSRRGSRVLSLVGTYRDEYIDLEQMLESGFRAYHDARKQPAHSAQDVGTLTGVEFETYIANLLKQAGFGVVGTPVTGDQGADLIAQKNGRTIAIQAKGCKEPVGNWAVQEIVGALKFYNAVEGWVVTNSNFTASARHLAHANSIRLIDGHDLRNYASSKGTLWNC